MANIPQHELYGTQTGGTKDTPASIASYSGALRAMRGRPSPVASGLTDYADISRARESFRTGETAVPVSRAIAPQPTERYTPLPTGYGLVNPFRPEEQVPTPPGATLRSLPGLTEGQYVIEREKPSAFLKSARSYIPEEKALILGNRPSSLYQVDHIIPIWAGGADTEANKQVLPINIHDEKTKAQAVPLTLLASGKISVPQARLMALQWKTYDLSDVPKPDERGMFPVSVAEEIKTRWEKQAAKPRVTWNDFLAEIPEKAKEFGKGWLPEPVREFAKGLVSGGTGSWIPYQPGEGQGKVEMAAGIAGNVAGMLVPVTLFSKMIGGLGRAASSVAASKGWIKAPIVADQVAKAAKIANFAESGKFGSSLVKNVAYGNLVRNTAALTLYGQLSKEGFEHRTGRFLEDLGYSAIMGVVPPTIKGAVLASGGALSLGLMIDPDKPRDAVINALVIGGLHTIGAPAVRTNLEKQLHLVKLSIENETTRAANNILSPYAGNKIKFLKPDDQIPSVEAYSSEDILRIREAANKRISTMLANETIDVDTAARERARVIVATNWLENRKLPEAMKDKKMIDDLLSVKDQSEKLGEGTITTPPIVKEVVDKMDESWMKTSFRAHDTDTPTGENPVGEIRLSGLGASEINEAGATYYLNAKSEGRASPTLFAVSMPEYEPIMQAVSNAYTAEQIVQRLQRPFANPQNSMPVFGVVVEPTGAKTVVRVGWMPREWKVGSTDSKVDQSKFSFNQTKEVREGVFKPLDSSLNKDTLTYGLNKKGARVLFLNYIDGGVAKTSQKPYIMTSLNDENWRTSAEYARKVSGGEKTASVQTNVKQVNSALNLKQKMAAIEEIKNKVQKSADQVLDNAPEIGGNPVFRQTTQNFIASAKTALSAETPEQMTNIFKAKMGITLTPEEAIQLFNRRNSVTVREIFNTVTKAVADGRAVKGIDAQIKSFVKPFFESSEYKNWELGKTFHNLRVVGGIAPVAQRATRFTQPQQAMPQPVVESVPTPAGAQPQLPLETTSPTRGIFTTKEGIKLQQETTPEGNIWLEQNKNKGSEWANLAKSGHTVEHLMLPNKGGYAGKVRINGKEMTYDEARQSFGLGGAVKPLVSKIMAARAKIPTEKPKTAPKTPLTQKLGAFTKQKIDTVPVEIRGEKGVSAVKSTVSGYTRNIQESMDELHGRGRDLIENAEVPGDRARYARILGGIIRSISPSGKVTTGAGKVRNYNTKEKTAIQNRVKPRLIGDAEQLVRSTFDPDQEIAFITGSLSKEPETLNAMRMVIKADTLRALGDIEEASNVLKQQDIEVVKNAAELLRMEHILSLVDKTGVKMTQAKPAFEPYTDKQIAALGQKREEEGKNIVKMIDSGVKKGPGTYEYGLATGLEKGLQRLFGNFRDKANLRFIGRAFIPDTAVSRSRFGRLYETVDTSRGMKEFAQPKEYLFAIGAGSRGAKATAEIKRMKQLSQAPEATGVDVVPPEVMSEVEGGRMRLTPAVQEEEMVKGLTRADTTVWPGLNALLEGGPGDPMRYGLEDARGLLQLITGRHNEDIRAGRSGRPTPGFTDKFFDDIYEKLKTASQETVKKG